MSTSLAPVLIDMYDKLLLVEGLDCWQREVELSDILLSKLAFSHDERCGCLIHREMFGRKGSKNGRTQSNSSVLFEDHRPNAVPSLSALKLLKMSKNTSIFLT